MTHAHHRRNPSATPTPNISPHTQPRWPSCFYLLIIPHGLPLVLSQCSNWWPGFASQQWKRGWGVGGGGGVKNNYNMEMRSRVWVMRGVKVEQSPSFDIPHYNPSLLCLATKFKDLWCYGSKMWPWLKCKPLGNKITASKSHTFIYFF